MIFFLVVTELVGIPIDPKELSTSERFDILDMLSRIHHLGVLHGDIKSENILVQRDGESTRFSIIGFGCSEITKNKERLNEEMSQLEVLLDVSEGKNVDTSASSGHLVNRSLIHLYC